MKDSVSLIFAKQLPFKIYLQEMYKFASTGENSH